MKLALPRFNLRRLEDCPQPLSWSPNPPIPPSLVCLLAMACAAFSPGDTATANGGRPTALAPRDGCHAHRVDAVDFTPSSRMGRQAPTILIDHSPHRLVNPPQFWGRIFIPLPNSVSAYRCAICYVAEWEVATIGLTPIGFPRLQAARRVAGRRRSVGGLSLRCRLFRLAVPQYATVPDFLPAL